MDQIDPPGAFPVLPLLIHGDAAFAGQGVVAEMPEPERHQGLPRRRHDPPDHQQPDRVHDRTRVEPIVEYCSDVAKTVQAPIFHVNGDDPEACVRVARMAFAYRQRFHKDVVIDMVCYRRHGHNEGDDPSYTQPLMYKAIAERRSVRKLYVESLVKRGDITSRRPSRRSTDFQGPSSRRARRDAIAGGVAPKVPRPPKPPGVLPHIPTGVERRPSIGSSRR
jgi:multifunctional 2-oxoglutarate metabolism enzyme